MKNKVWIEGDGATDSYGIAFRFGKTTFTVVDLTRYDCDAILKTLRAEFNDLREYFDSLSQSKKKEEA